MSAHIPGRLTVRGGYSIYADDGKTPVADTCLTNSVPDNDEANARRLVACWNACEGISTHALEVVVGMGASVGDKIAALETSERELMDQRDELLAALNGLLAYFESGNSVPVSQATIKANSAEVLAARAAIAKVGGEELANCTEMLEREILKPEAECPST